MDIRELGYQAIALGFDRVDQVGFVDGGEHPVDGADQVALTAVAQEVVEREGELVEVAFAQGKFGNRTIGEIRWVLAGRRRLAVAAVAIGVEASELRTLAAVFGKRALDRVPGRVAMAVDVVACDPIRNPLEAEAGHQPVVEGRGVAALDRPAETSRSGLLIGLPEEPVIAGQQANGPDQLDRLSDGADHGLNTRRRASRSSPGP